MLGLMVYCPKGHRSNKCVVIKIWALRSESLGFSSVSTIFFAVNVNHLAPLSFSGSLAGKESVCNAGDRGLIPGLRRSPREGIGYPLKYS